MVSGLGNPSAGLFSSPRTEPRNDLLLDPVFEPPEDDLREADRRRRERGKRGQNPPGRSVNLTVVPRLGEPVQHLAARESSGESGGSTPLLVEGGTVELRASGTNKRFRIDPEDEVTVRRGDGGITLTNRTTGAEQSFAEGTDIRVEGEGRATLAGTSTLSVSAGARLRVSSAGERTRITLPDSTEGLNLTGDTPVRIEGESGQQLVLHSDRGRTVRFGAGDTGSLRLGDNGRLVVRNDDTGREVSFDPASNIRAGGEATARIDKPGGLDVSGGESLSLRDPDGENPRLVKPDSERSTSLLPAQEGLQPSRPLRLQILNHPESQRIQALGSRLVVETGGEQKGSGDPRTRNGGKDSDESKQAGTAASFSDESTPSLPASFRGDETETNRSKNDTARPGSTEKTESSREQNKQPSFPRSHRPSVLEGDSVESSFQADQNRGFSSSENLGLPSRDMSRIFDFSGSREPVGTLFQHRA